MLLAHSVADAVATLPLVGILFQLHSHEIRCMCNASYVALIEFSADRLIDNDEQYVMIMHGSGRLLSERSRKVAAGEVEVAGELRAYVQAVSARFTCLYSRFCSIHSADHGCTP